MHGIRAARGRQYVDCFKKHGVLNQGGSDDILQRDKPKKNTEMGRGTFDTSKRYVSRVNHKTSPELPLLKVILYLYRSYLLLRQHLLHMNVCFKSYSLLITQQKMRRHLNLARAAADMRRPRPILARNGRILCRLKRMNNGIYIIATQPMAWVNHNTHVSPDASLIHGLFGPTFITK